MWLNVPAFPRYLLTPSLGSLNCLKWMLKRHGGRSCVGCVRWSNCDAYHSISPPTLSLFLSVRSKYAFKHSALKRPQYALQPGNFFNWFSKFSFIIKSGCTSFLFHLVSEVADNCFVLDREIIAYNLLSSSLSLLHPFETIKSPF